MNVLFIGGSGQISTAVSRLAVKKGINLTVLNRGNKNSVLPNEITQLTGDIYNVDQMKELLKGKSYDCVVQWIAFNTDHVKRDYELFNKITKQYIFISSASAYQKPVVDYPITENTPLENPYWQYSRDKIACEDYLNSVHSDEFNVTIVRPSHTYDDFKLMTIIKTWGGEYGHIDRLLKGKKIIIPGDGTSLWTITHNTDFADAFVELLGNEKAYGESYHITSDKVYTWDRLNEIIADALNVKADVVHIPTDFILKYLPHMEGDLVGDKMWSAIFDNSKIKTIAPNYSPKVRYEDIAKGAVKYFLENKEMQNIDTDFEQVYDKIIADFLKK
jgi:nucleoside-diphosphate-sugar epimerase